MLHLRKRHLQGCKHYISDTERPFSDQLDCNKCPYFAVPRGFASTGNVGRIPQMRLDANDNDGHGQRAISMALTRPAQQYTYTSARPYPTGQKVLVTCHAQQGFWTGPCLIDAGRWPEDSVNRTNYTPITVTSGSNIAVEFGYDPAFECTPRAERCIATSATIDATTPFKFGGEAWSATSPSVTLPGLPGRVMFWRVVGSEQTYVIAVP